MSNRIEELRNLIKELEQELHKLLVEEWWAKRPHIKMFEFNVQYECNDEGGNDPFFKPYFPSLELNKEWISANQEKWINFCTIRNISSTLDLENDDYEEDFLLYFEGIDSESWSEYEFPNFETLDYGTLINPNL